VFSGIVETQKPVVRVAAANTSGLVRIEVERPVEFDDLHIGDSICNNGVCLTVEAFNSETMTFALGAETLAITGWSPESLKGFAMNLERSLRLQDRIHGHLVSGHVDVAGEVVRADDAGGSLLLDVAVASDWSPYVWQKGSWAVNGVSLTINSIRASGSAIVVSHCLIPETLRRTNLGSLKVGSRVNLEMDMTARGLVSFLKTSLQAQSSGS
jgi:riboflavin synthase